MDGKSDFIISGDRHLLDLKEYKNIKILTSRELLEKYNRAKNVKKPYDEVSSGGSLTRGVIFTEKPSFNYHNNLKLKDRTTELNKLNELIIFISNELNIPAENLDIDPVKYRILTYKSIVKKNKGKLKKMGLVPAITEELATGDLFEIETNFL